MPTSIDLTSKGIAALDPTTAEIFWDASVKGFGLRTRKLEDSAKWRWLLSYREGGGSGTQVKLSVPYADKTPTEARKWAARERGLKDTAEGYRAKQAEKRRLREEDRLCPTMKRLWEEYWEAVRRGRVHDLRHTAATLTLRATRSLVAVQAQLGHATPLTTRRYAHLMREQMIETGSILGAFGEGAGGRGQTAKVLPLTPPAEAVS